MHDRFGIGTKLFSPTTLRWTGPGPEADVEIESQDVQWSSNGLDVQGTMTGPRGSDPHGAVVLVAGSGPTDRNWCSPMLPGNNGSGGLLAEELARRGYLTLRYDKMGSGPRARETATRMAGKVSMRTFREELAGAVRTVAERSGSSAGRLFALTNSEGAIHAVNYQREGGGPPFHAMVMTGAPGRAIGVVGRSQLIAQGESLPNLSELVRLYDESIDRFLAGRPSEPDPKLPDGVRQLIRALENPYNLPFARELWTYDLAEHLPKVEVPVLVLIGRKDVQIDWQVDGGTLQRATSSRPDVTFAFPAEANHVLKHEPAPREQLNGARVGERYNAPGVSLDPETVRDILDWFDRQP